MKRFALAIIAVTMLISGCSTKMQQTLSVPTIHWYLPKAVENMSEQENVENKANEIFVDKVGAKLKFHLLDRSAYADKMNVMIAARDKFDFLLTGNDNYLINMRKGAFSDVKPLVEKYGPAIMAKVDPKAWEAVTFEGKQFAIPGQNQYSIPAVMVFKKEFIDKYHFDYNAVTQLKDLEPYLEKIKQNEVGITPLLNIAANSVTERPQEHITPICSGVAYDENEEVCKLDMDFPENIENIKLLNKYFQKGYIAKDAATKTDYMAEAKSGKYAVLPNVGAYSKDGSKSSSVYGFPCTENLMGYIPLRTQTMIAAMTSLSSTSENPEKAIQLLNLVWEDSNLSNMLAYGLEGINYEVISGKGTPEMSVVPKAGKEQTWAIWHNWLGPLWDQWDSPWNSKESLLAMQENNKSAKSSKLIGFLFDPEPVKNELAQIGAIGKAAGPVLSTGSMPDVDEYIAALQKKYKDAGIDKVLEEANKQVAEWKKANKE